MPADCEDPDCHACRAARDGLELAAMWRKWHGKEIFMGIVRLPTSEYTADGPPMDLFKLNDHNGELDGPGHAMTDEEFLTECAHYDNSSFDSPIQYLPLLDMRTFLPINSSQMECFQSNGAIGVLSFRGMNPQDFTDSQDEEFSVKFPKQLQVRAGDTVKIAAAGFTASQGQLAPFRERFWVHVVSVTRFGIITGTSANELNSCGISPESGYIAFHSTAVIGVCHGEHWNVEEEGGEQGGDERKSQEDGQGDK